MTAPDLSADADLGTAEHDQRVEWFRRFGNTERASRLASKYPKAAGEGDVLWRVLGRGPLPGHRIPVTDSTTAEPAPGKSDYWMTLLRNAAGTAAERAHLDTVALPVEVRRPRQTPAEVIGVYLASAVSTAIGVAFVRAAARRILGVQLTRRDAWLLTLAAHSLGRGSAWQIWTRQAARTPRPGR